MQRVVLGVDRQPVALARSANRPSSVAAPAAGPGAGGGSARPPCARCRARRQFRGQPQLRRIAASRKAWSTSATCTTSTSPGCGAGVRRTARRAGARPRARSVAGRGCGWRRPGRPVGADQQPKGGGRGGPAADHPEPPGGDDRVGGRVQAGGLEIEHGVGGLPPGQATWRLGGGQVARTGSGRSARASAGAASGRRRGPPAGGACSADQVGLEADPDAFLAGVEQVDGVLSQRRCSAVRSASATRRRGRRRLQRSAWWRRRTCWRYSKAAARSAAVLPTVPRSVAARSRAAVASSALPASRASSRARSTIGAVPCAFRSILPWWSPRSWRRKPSGGRRRSAARGQAAEEPPVAGRLADHRPQRRLGVQVAMELAEVEEDGRIQQRLLLGLLDPAAELVLPGAAAGRAWLGWWPDVAGTAGQAAALQGRRQVLGQGREPRRRRRAGRRPAPGRGPGRCEAWTPPGRRCPGPAVHTGTAAGRGPPRRRGRP